jgi:hypothetical protein
MMRVFRYYPDYENAQEDTVFLCTQIMIALAELPNAPVDDIDYEWAEKRLRQLYQDIIDWRRERPGQTSAIAVMYAFFGQTMEILGQAIEDELAIEASRPRQLWMFS